MNNPTYALCITLRRDKNISVGRLGTLKFNKGFYAYAGSAKRNFPSRIKRHLKKNKKLFWHIDYLLSSSPARIRKVWAGRKTECALAGAFSRQGFNKISRFGSSDCRCPTHLFFAKDISLLSFLLKREGFTRIKDI